MAIQIKEFELHWTEEYPIFSSSGYLKSVGESYGWIGGFLGERLVCFLPFTRKSKIFLAWVTFQTATIFAKDVEPDLSTEKRFLEGVINYFRKQRIDFITQGPTHAIFKSYPGMAVFVPFASYQLDLRKDKEELWTCLHGKHRNVIRNAEKRGVEIAHSHTYLDVAYNIMKETMARQGIGFQTKEQLSKLVFNLHEHVEIFVATFCGQYQGCAIILYSEYAAYYLLGGSIEKPVLGSLNLLHWVAINYFKDLGVGIYDFVGARIGPPKNSKLEGIQKFKERFGGKMNEGYIWKYIYSNLKYCMYAALVQMKSKQAWVDIIDQELHFHER